MAKRPRTTYYQVFGSPRGFGAKVAGFGVFEVWHEDDRIRTMYRGQVEEVGFLTTWPDTFAQFKDLFDAWWTAIAPWENIVYDIVVYDRLGRSMGTATEVKPLVARRRARELAEAVNGARAIILRRNKRTLEVTQVYGYKRRPRRATASTP
jgi:hypothetical protein